MKLPFGMLLAALLGILAGAFWSWVSPRDVRARLTLPLAVGLLVLAGSYWDPGSEKFWREYIGSNPWGFWVVVGVLSGLVFSGRFADRPWRSAPVGAGQG